MTQIQKSITIQAPICAVQAILNDASRHTEWVEGMRGLDAKPGYPTQLGSCAIVNYRAAGFTLQSRLKVVRNIPKQVQEFEMEGMLNGIKTWSLSQVGGDTRVDLTIFYEVADDGFGKVMDKFLIERMNDKNAERSLTNLKALAETLQTFEEIRPVLSMD